MCVSLPILAVIGSVASAAVGFMGQMAQYKAAEAHYQANAKAAKTAAINRYASEETKAKQEAMAASQKKQQVAMKAAAARSTARVAAGEAGVSGLSVDALLQDVTAQQGRYEASVDQNFEINQQYLRGEMKATQDQAQARINAVPMPTAPSFGAALVNAFGSGISAYVSAGGNGPASAGYSYNPYTGAPI